MFVWDIESAFPWERTCLHSPVEHNSAMHAPFSSLSHTDGADEASSQEAFNNGNNHGTGGSALKPDLSSGSMLLNDTSTGSDDRSTPGANAGLEANEGAQPNNAHCSRTLCRLGAYLYTGHCLQQIVAIHAVISFDRNAELVNHTFSPFPFEWSIFGDQLRSDFLQRVRRIHSDLTEVTLQTEHVGHFMQLRVLCSASNTI